LTKNSDNDKLAFAAGERCLCVCREEPKPARLFQIQLVSEQPGSELQVIETEPVYGREVHFFAWPDERTAEALNEIAWELVEQPQHCGGISVSQEVEDMLEIEP